MYLRGLVFLAGAAFWFALGLRLVYSQNRLGFWLGLGMFGATVNNSLQAAYVLYKANAGGYPPWIDGASWFNACLSLVLPILIYVVFERLCKESKDG